MKTLLAIIPLLCALSLNAQTLGLSPVFRATTVPVAAVGGGSSPTIAYQWIATNTLTLTNTVGANPTNLDLITIWKDQVGGVLFQTNSSSLPQYLTAIQNSKAGLKFAANKTLTNHLASALTSGNYTVLIACKRSGSVGAFEGLLDSTVNDTTRMAVYMDSSSPSHFVMYAGTALTSSTTTTTNTSYIVGARFNGASSSLWVNGVSVASGNTGSNTSLQNMLLGTLASNTALTWQGHIFEVRVYTSMLSDADLTTAFNDMNGTWAIY